MQARWPFFALMLIFTFVLMVPSARDAQSMPPQIYHDGDAPVGQGTIDDAFSHFYAPSAMYDHQEGKFKVWACSGMVINGQLEEVIGYREASTYEGLAQAQRQASFRVGASNKWDGTHVCDPSVIEFAGKFYLYYSGINADDNAEFPRTRIGVAISHDRGRSFHRLNNGNFIIEPVPTEYKVVPALPHYGTGQPSVVRAPDGYFYMIYTNRSSDTVNKFTVIRSLNPSFPPGQQEFVRDFADTSIIGGWSVDLTYNISRNNFVIVAGSGQSVVLAHTDNDFNIIGRTILPYNSAGFTFGEGIGILTDSYGYLERFPHLIDTVKHINVMGATNSFSGNRNQHIEGPTNFVRFQQGPNGVVAGFADRDDFPISGDLDNDGIKDIIVVDTQTFIWSIKLSSSNFARLYEQQWGLTGDVPVILNRDGRDRLGVWRPSDGKWYIHKSGTSYPNPFPDALHELIPWGLPGDIPVAGDFTGEGEDDVAVWRPSNGTFYVKPSNTPPNGNANCAVISPILAPHGTGCERQWGLFGDVPVSCDHANDGKNDFCVWRPSNSTFYIRDQSGAIITY